MIAARLLRLAAMESNDAVRDPGAGAVSSTVPAADQAALDAMFSAAYEELRRLARAVRRDDANATIDPTALVNEAWLKLAGTPGLASTSPLHFRRIAARAMRQVLVEAARRRHAESAAAPTR